MLDSISRMSDATIVRGCLALVGGVLVCIAVVLSFNDPEITYSADVIEKTRDIQVTCTDDVDNGTSNDLSEIPLLDDGEHLRPRYEPTRGADVLDGVIDRANEANASSGTVQRGINADCVAARAHRTDTTVRMLGAALLLALAAIVASLFLRERDRHRDEATTTRESSRR